MKLVLKKTFCLFIALLSIQFFINAECPPQKKGGKEEISIYPILNRDEKGNLEIIIPPSDSNAFDVLQKVIANSITLKNMIDDIPSGLQCGAALPLPKLSLKAVESILVLAARSILDKDLQIEAFIKDYSFIELAHLAQAANYLDMPKLLEISMNALTMRLLSAQVLTELNKNPKNIAQLKEIIGSDLEKQIAKKIYTRLSIVPFQEELKLSGHPPLNSIGLPNKVWLVTFSPDNSKLASLVDGKIIVWDAKTGNKLKELTVDFYGEDNEIFFNADGTQLIAYIGDKKEVWDINNAKLVEEAFYQKSGKRRGSCQTSNKQISALVEENGIIEFSKWLPSGKLVFYNAQGDKHKDKINALAFSSDSSKLASAGDGVIIWDVESGHKIQKIKGDEAIYSVAFSSDDVKLAIGTRNGSVSIWKLKAQTLPSLSFDKLITFLIANELGKSQLNKDLAPTFDSLPKDIKDLAK